MKNNAIRDSMAGVGGLYQVPNFNSLQLANGYKCPTAACATPPELANLKTPAANPTNTQIIRELTRAKVAAQPSALPTTKHPHHYTTGARMMKRLQIIAAIIYALAGIAAFGHSAANVYTPCPDTGEYCSSDTSQAAIGGIIAGIFWPLYLSWELATTQEGQ